ncbi:MAG: DNA-formamidopyrimidine glycosylase [Spirulinaceae cyanobacterium]
MPELPEVETVRKGLNQLTLQQEIKGGEVLLKRSLAYPVSVPEFWSGLEGVGIASWQRRGKYLLAQLDNSAYLGVHLRMTGQLLWVKQTEPLQKHTRIRIFVGDEKELRFVDIRTFGKVWLVPPGQEITKIITGLQKLGPEPFDPEFSCQYLGGKLQKTGRSIKVALLDQGIVAGIGNIYADEALFKSGIRPETIAKDLSFAQVTSLHRAIVEVLQTAIDKGGTTFSDFLNLLGVSGNYGDQALVYGRKGEPCRLCSTTIERIKLGGRSAHFCPRCQKKG